MPTTVARPDGPGGALGCVLSTMAVTSRVLASQVRELEEGWSASTPELPLVWALNELHLDQPTGPARAVELAEVHQGDLPYRHLVVEDAFTAEALAGELEGRSLWRHDRLALMVLAPDGGPPAPAVPRDRSAPCPLTEDQSGQLAQQWLSEDFPALDGQTLGQLDELNRRAARLLSEERFGFLGPDGSPVAMVKLQRKGDVAWLLDVYTVPRCRGRGYARALVAHAARRARELGARTVFIVADDNDWPKQLYGRLGFLTVGVLWQFHLALPELG